MKTLPADLEALMPEPDGYAAMTPNGTVIVPPSRFREFNGYAIFTADQMREAILAATERAAKVEREACAVLCDELREHYSDFKDTALLNGDVELSNAASGEPRACEAVAAAIRARTGGGQT